MAVNDKEDKAISEAMYGSLIFEDGLEKYRKFTKKFELFPQELKDSWRLLAKLETDETPIYGCFRSEKHWLLATTRRMIWMDFFDEDGLHSLNYGDIELVCPVGSLQDNRFETHLETHVRDKCLVVGKAPLDYRQQFLPPPYNELINPHIINPWLLIVDRLGKEHEIYVENGAVVGGAFVCFFQLMTNQTFFDKMQRKYHGIKEAST
jgi:hypothetical protein